MNKMMRVVDPLWRQTARRMRRALPRDVCRPEQARTNPGSLDLLNLRVLDDARPLLHLLLDVDREILRTVRDHVETKLRALGLDVGKCHHADDRVMQLLDDG